VGLVAERACQESWKLLLPGRGQVARERSSDAARWPDSALGEVSAIEADAGRRPDSGDDVHDVRRITRPLRGACASSTPPSRRQISW